MRYSGLKSPERKLRESMAKQITTSIFDIAPDVHPVQCFTMTNAKGAQVQLLEYGACIHQVLVPDKTGRLDNVTFCFPALVPELRALSCSGSICGPVANRITGAAFELNGVRYELEQNNGENHLHGGSAGFHRLSRCAVLFRIYMQRTPLRCGIGMPVLPRRHVSWELSFRGSPCGKTI